MMRVLSSVLLAGALLGSCNRQPRPRGDLALRDVRLEAGPAGAVAHFTVSLTTLPPGDARKLFVELGADQFVGTVRTVEWPELTERDSDPATNGDTTPLPGATLMVAVPIEIIPAFSTKHAPNFDVVANAFWGTDAEGPVHQAHVVTTVEHLYEREVRR